MSTPRQMLADAVTGQLPADVRVEAYAHDLDSITRQTVMLRLDEVGPYPPAPEKHRLYKFSLILLEPKTSAGPADDALEQLLEDVLYAIEQTPDVDWSTATRGLWLDDTTPAFEVVLEVPFTKE